MKTVGEFLADGLDFIKGDKCYKHRESGDEFHRHWHEAPRMYSDKIVSEFAWRENTGVKPKFSGLIEWVGSYSDFVYVNRSDELIWWDRKCIAKWRPSLNQPSVAETDTKESEIHKAWVALKGDLNNVIDDIQGSKDSILKCISGIGSFSIGDYAFCVGNFHNKSVWEYVCATQEFTNYCEKMAAEEKCMDIIGQNCNDGLHYDNTNQQVEVIVNNNTPFSIELAEKGGFSCEFNAKELDDKPIFTQVMADDGEFPPVGAKAKVCIEKAGFDIDNSDLKFEGKVVIIRAAFANEEGEKIVAIENEDGNCACYIIECIESLDTRTDREKAIDAALHEWPASDKATLEIAYDFWRVGESTIYDW